MVKKGESFFKKGFSDSWNYLRESKSFIWASVIIFFVFVLGGFFIPPSDFIAGEILKILKELMAKTEGLSGGRLILFIFLNNLSSSFLGLFLGIVAGVYSLFAVIFNGYVLGFVARLVVAEEGIFVLWKLIPHGIFEFPAIFISFGLGLKLGISLLRKEKRRFLKSYLMKSLEVFVFVILPFLIVAAIIEGILIVLTR